MIALNRALSVLFALTAGSAVAQSPASPPIVSADGKISGVRQEDVVSFLGVPFAAPPIGPNRWRAPQSVQPWKGTLAADHFGPSCPQAIIPSLGPWTHEYLPSGATNEDCLTLNVWAPAKGAKNLPVLVWIHGGGFTSGSASVPVYDGSALARRGIVVVSINYRLGFLGSLASAETRDTSGGDFGLQDQIAALRWVQRNIDAFGGDPKRVTISGQSAGAISVHYLIMSPLARGLFHQAIAQSGIGLGVGKDLALPPRDSAEKSATAFLTAAGVNSIEEARKLSFAQLTAAYMKVGGRPGTTEGVRIGPYADGKLLPLDPARAFEEGRYNDSPLLIGLTNDEGSGLNPSYRTSDPARYEQWLRARFGALAPEFEKIYVPKEGTSAIPGLIRDSGIAATLSWGRERNRTSRFPMFGYIWTHVEPGPESARYGAFHTSEVPYIFGTLSKAPERNFTEDDRTISREVQSYWVNFVKTGDPNGPTLPHWPAFGRRETLMEIGQRFGPYPALDPRAEALFQKHVSAGGSLLAF